PFIVPGSFNFRLSTGCDAGIMDQGGCGRYVDLCFMIELLTDVESTPVVTRSHQRLLRQTGYVIRRLRTYLPRQCSHRKIYSLARVLAYVITIYHMTACDIFYFIG